MNSEILDRVPPHDLDAERGVIGSALLDPRVMADVGAMLQPGDFHNERHARFYKHFVELWDNGQGSVDATLLQSSMRNNGGWSNEDAASIAELFQLHPNPADVQRYANIVKEHSEQRTIIRTAEEILQAAHNGVAPSVLRQRIETATERIDAGGLRYSRLSCAELDRGNYELEYLIDRTLVAGQPCIVAGGKKCLKTSILLDMGISLAMGGFFLGKLKVNRACKVGIMTGESGLATIQETARRICRAAGYRLGDIGGLVFSEDLPRFGNLNHEDALRRFIMDDELEVLVIDPAYLCLPGADPGNLFAQGDLLRGMSKVCTDTGCMMILAHHTRKTKTDPFSPPELEDIAWAGFQEFARQWLLVGRRSVYEPGTGDHRLWLSVGGSAGHTALWAADVSEGTRETEGGRFWEVELMHADEARDEVQERKEFAKQAKAVDTVERDKRTICNTMAKFPQGESKTVIRDCCGLHTRSFNPAFADLINDGAIVPCSITKANRRTPYAGFMLAGDTTHE